MMRQAVGVGVERGVAQRAVLEHHRDRVRRAQRLRGKQRRQGRSRQRRPSRHCAGVVPDPQDGVALGRVQDRQAASARRRIGHRALQQPDQPLPQRRDAGLVEQVAGVFQHALDAGRRAVGRRAARLSPTDRSNFALAVAIGCGRHREPGSSSAGACPAVSVSNASITWNSGCRDSDRAGLSTSTSRSNGSSAWP